jgi:hypothetical protein
MAAFESLLHDRDVNDAPFDHVELSAEPLEILSSSTREVVEDSYDLPLREQRAGDRGSDEAGAPGDEVNAHAAPSTRSSFRRR